MSIRDAGTTIRQPSTALLTIDSEDRFADWRAKRAATPNSFNFSPYDFTLIRNATLVNGYMTRLAISEVVFPWTIPNVNQKTSKILVDILIDGVNYVNNLIELPLQFMSPHVLAVTLALAVQVVINAAPISRPDITFGMAYGSGELPRFDYYIDPNCGIAFHPIPAPSSVYNYPFSNTTKQLFDLLGFTDQNQAMVVAVAPGVQYPRFGQATFAQAIRYIDIVCPQLTANQGLPDSTSQAVGHTSLCRLYLGDSVPGTQTLSAGDVDFAPTGTQPFTIYRQFTFPKQIAWNAIQPVQSSLQFQVFDDNGELINPIELGYTIIPSPIDPEENTTKTEPFVAYADWSMTLLLSEN